MKETNTLSIHHIKGTLITLRDMVYEDIFDYVNWFTKETEWMNWDAPWEKDIESNEDILFQRFSKRYEYLKQQTSTRKRFEIVLNDIKQTHIGWVSSYLIDDSYLYHIHGNKTAIGIDIPNPKYRGFGYGNEAIMLFIKHLYQHDEESIYLQTWSGNQTMIGLAKKMGFEEVHRISNLRTVNEKAYDALTFIHTR